MSESAETATSPVVQAIRAKLMEERALVPAFAAGINRTPRTVQSWIAQGMPVEYIGRTPYVLVDDALDWLRSQRQKRCSNPRGRGRPKKA